MTDSKLETISPQTPEEEKELRKWNDSLKQALMDNNYASFSFIFSKKKDDFLPADEIFNLLVASYINDKRSHNPLKTVMKYGFDKIIPNFEITLSDNDFKQLMFRGGFGRIFEGELINRERRSTPGLWKHKNIQDYLVLKFSDPKYIQLAINEAFNGKHQYDAIFTAIDACYEVLAFTPQNNKQYAIDLICKKLDKSNFINIVKNSNQLIQKSLLLLEAPSEFNLKVSGNFWNELKNEFLKHINKRVHQSEASFMLHDNLNFFNLFAYEYANIPKTLGIHYGPEVLDNYLNNAGISRKRLLSSLKDEQSHHDKSPRLSIAFACALNASFNIYKILRDRSSSGEASNDLFFEKISSFITNKDVCFLEDNLLKADVNSIFYSSIKPKFVDNLNQLKKFHLMKSLNIDNNGINNSKKLKLKI